MTILKVGLAVANYKTKVNSFKVSHDFAQFIQFLCSVLVRMCEC